MPPGHDERGLLGQVAGNGEAGLQSPRLSFCALGQFIADAQLKKYGDLTHLLHVGQ